MATTFPTSIQTFTDPTGVQTLSAGNHAGLHTDINDTMEALEAKVGVNSSAVTTSHDYKLSGVTGSDKAVSLTGSEALTNKTLTSPTITSPSITTFSTLNAPKGFLINGKIVPSVASNNLTVALKGMDGNDPSASNPVYVRIGNIVRTVTFALSVTMNAATNWFNLGDGGQATNETDLFVYLLWVSASSAVSIGVSRRSHFRTWGESTNTSTSDNCLNNSNVNVASADNCVVIGRFAATLSAGAGYTWSVPTFTNLNLIQNPIYNTRWLNYTPTYTGFSANPTAISRYYINNNSCVVNHVATALGTSNATTYTMTIPISASANGGTGGNQSWIFKVFDSGAGNAGMGYIASATTLEFFKTAASGAFTNSGTKGAQIHFEYEI